MPNQYYKIKFSNLYFSKLIYFLNISKPHINNKKDIILLNKIISYLTDIPF